MMPLWETNTQGNCAKRVSRSDFSVIRIYLELHLYQTGGGMGLAEVCLEDVPPQCVNCGVYQWKQVKSLFSTLTLFQFSHCLCI